MFDLKRSRFFALAPLLFLAMGCDPRVSLQATAGKYHGIWYSRAPGDSAETPVDVEVTSVSSTEMHIAVSGDTGPNGGAPSYPTFEVKFEKKKKNKISLDVDTTPPEHYDLVPAYANCYASKTDNSIPDAPTALICANGVDLSVNLGGRAASVSLSMTKEQSGDQPILETPAAYSLSDLMTRAKDRGFTSAVDFDRVLEAKWKTQNAYLNLIPHLSANSVLNIASLNLLGYLKAVGDLVPFLFPTRWIEAKEAHFENEAEFDGWVISQADGMNVVEGLGIGVLRDIAVISTVKKNFTSIQILRDKMIEREKAGLMQAGSSDEITSILDGLTDALSELEASLIQEKMALAEGAGFTNYAAVTDVTDDSPLDIKLEKPFDAGATEKVSQAVIDGSYERKQMDSLISIAKLNHKASYFQWLDPSGDRDGGFGLGLVPYVKISVAEVQEFNDRKTQLVVDLGQAIARTTALANQALERYRISQANLVVQNRRVSRHLGNLSTGIGFSMSDLTSSLQAQMQAEMDSLESEYENRLALSNLNRLLLAGPYESLAFEVMPAPAKSEAK